MIPPPLKKHTVILSIFYLTYEPNPKNETYMVYNLNLKTFFQKVLKRKAAPA